MQGSLLPGWMTFARATRYLETTVCAVHGTWIADDA